MAQGYTEQTENAFTHQIANAIAKHTTKIKHHLTSGASDEVESHFETIGQLLELRQAIADREPTYVIPMVRSRCGDIAS